MILGQNPFFEEVGLVFVVAQGDFEAMDLGLYGTLLFVHFTQRLGQRLVFGTQRFVLVTRFDHELARLEDAFRQRLGAFDVDLDFGFERRLILF